MPNKHVSVKQKAAALALTEISGNSEQFAAKKTGVSRSGIQHIRKKAKE